MSSEYYRLHEKITLGEFKVIDTMKTTIDYCQLRFGKEGVVSLVEPKGMFKDYFKFKITLY